MSTTEQTTVYRFRDNVALTVHARNGDGLDIRTSYMSAAHALRLAAALVTAAIDCAELPEERSACGTVAQVANDCGDVADAMGEVVQLTDREAMRGDHALLEKCACHLLHYQTLPHAHPDAAKHAADFHALLRSGGPANSAPMSEAEEDDD